MLCEFEYFIVVLLITFITFLSLKSKKEVVRDTTVLILPSTSHVLKAYCCIIIILHHWALRYPTPIMDGILTNIGGGIV